MASSTLVELTTRLDFFKERRSQLMEQLHNLDLSHGTSSQGTAHKFSPPWNSPRWKWDANKHNALYIYDACVYFCINCNYSFSYSLYSLKSSDDAAKYSLVICNGCNDLNGRNDHAKVVNPVLLIFFYLFFIFLSDCCCSLW